MLTTLGFGILHFKARQSPKTSFLARCLRIFDSFLITFSYLPFVQTFSKLIHNWGDSVIDSFLERSEEAFLDSRSDRDQLEEAVNETVVGWDVECAALETKLEEFTTKLADEFSEKIKSYEESLRENKHRALADYRQSIGASDARIDSGEILNFENLRKLWAACPAEAPAVEQKSHAIVNALVEEILKRPGNFKFNFPGSAHILVNSLVWNLLSPVFRKIEGSEISVEEISRFRFETVCEILECKNDQVDSSAAIAALNVADYFGLNRIFGNLDLEISPEAAVALFVAESSSSRAPGAAPEVSLSEIDDSALACLEISSFRKLLGSRKFSRRVDLLVLEKFKAGNFNPFEFLDVENLRAPVLPDCERMLSAEDYATLLTCVLANIEQENARLSRLSRTKPPPTPERTFRYSVN